MAKPRLSSPSNRLIAVVGMACRFPGATNLHCYRDLLRNGNDAVKPASNQRLKILPNYSSELKNHTAHYSLNGGFLPQVDQFDAGFFRCSKTEAARMDPQQRLLLEVTWESLEDAGEPSHHLAGQDVGVFVGVMNPEFHQIQMPALTQVDGHLGTGSSLGIAANRLSYFYNFQGPSIAVDTLCSSSLVALHMACQSLITKESSPVAIAGGVNIILSPAMTIFYSRTGLLAEDGRCKAFDANANGLVRGEGCGVVILKTLDNALKDGNRIYALVRGSAVNQNGKGNGITSPNRWAQEAVLKKAYLKAAVSPGDVQYVEAQGTGTLLGDRIETTALGEVLAKNRKKSQPCAIGSVKTNIGHLESASGIAGFIKTVLSLKHREIYPSLHFKEPNPLIKFETLPLKVQRHCTEWNSAEKYIAGVSAFGLGGTNAHVVLEAYENISRPSIVVSNEIPETQILCVSARCKAALAALAESYIEQLTVSKRQRHDSLADICFMASVKRSHHAHRLTVTGNTDEEISKKLKGYLGGVIEPGVFVASVNARRKPNVIFSFPEDTKFIDAKPLNNRESYIKRLCSGYKGGSHLFVKNLQQIKTISDQMKRSSEIEEFVNRSEILLFALQITLVSLWRKLGVNPNQILSSGLGQAAAQVAAGEDMAAALEYLFGARPKTIHKSAPLLNQKLPKDNQKILLQFGGDDSSQIANVSQAGENNNINHTISCVCLGDDRRANILNALGKLHVLGVTIDWREVYSRRQYAGLPAYPWQRKPYWLAQQEEKLTEKTQLYGVEVQHPYFQNRQVVKPQSDLERMLVDIWANVLEQDDISIHDNYFEIGGTSLRALEIMSRVNRSLKVNIHIRTLFDTPTIAQLAQRIEDILIEEIELLSDEEAEQLLMEKVE